MKKLTLYEIQQVSGASEAWNTPINGLQEGALYGANKAASPFMDIMDNCRENEHQNGGVKFLCAGARLTAITCVLGGFLLGATGGLMIGSYNYIKNSFTS